MVGITRSKVICGSGGSKSRLAKAAGAEPAGRMRDEKLHAVVARSTFRSQNVQNTSASDHFWKLRCRKSARRCGAKHISKSKCTKHITFGPLLEVQRFRCRKSAGRCGAKDISKSNVQNTSRSDHFWRFRCRFASLHYITLSRVWSLFPFYNRSILQAVSHKGDRDTGRQELRPTMTNQFS